MNLIYCYIFKLQQTGSGEETLLHLFQVLYEEQQDLAAMTFGDKGTGWGIKACPFQEKKKKKKITPLTTN